MGAGNWARSWGPIVKACQRVEIAGWVDIRPDAAAQAAQRLGLEKIHTGTDLDRAIALARPDFVINLSVPTAHRDVSIEAMEAGLPVLCEKPMAASMEQAREMVAVSERTGRLLMISQQRTHDPRLWAMRRLIDDRVGPLAILNSDFYIGHPTGAFHHDMPSPLLLDMAIHTFDAARSICGADPVAVYCEHFNPPWSWWKGNASTTAIFEMTGGLRYTYRGSWCSQGFRTSWQSSWRAVGPHGTALWDGETAPEAELVAEIGVFPASVTRIVQEPETDGPVSLSRPLNAFLDALDTGERPLGECHDNIKSLAMVFGAIESAMSGRRVALEPEPVAAQPPLPRMG